MRNYFLSLKCGILIYSPTSSPISGYLTRQISFLLNNYRFVEGEDKENIGLLVPRYVATGRTAPGGSVYGQVTKKNEDDFVLVRSIVTKTAGNLNEITPDLFSKQLLKAGFEPGSAVGISLGTSFTEGTTQSLLGLKHGGHERVQSTEGNFIAPKHCTLEEQDLWLILKVRGGELKYPKPSNWIGLGKEEFEEGDVIGAAYNTQSPIYKLNALIKLMQARGNNPKRYFERDSVQFSECYAYEDGEIHYVEGKSGIDSVNIGGHSYSYCPEVMYYFPEGYKVKKFQRFCAGVVNMGQVSFDLEGDINSIFTIFRRQMYQLISGSFAKEGIVGSGDTQEEIIELLFTGLTNVSLDATTGKIDSVDYLGSQGSILNKKSFFTTLSYGYGNKAIARAIEGDMEIENDIMTSTILGLLSNATLDSEVGQIRTRRGF